MDLLTVNDRPEAYPTSWYAATVTPPAPKPPLEGEITADVCVIGGGYTGLSAALHAAEAGLSVVLLEAQRIGFGASGRNGGQVGTGQRIDQDALETMVGKTRARALWVMGIDSVALVKSLVPGFDVAAFTVEVVGDLCAGGAGRLSVRVRRARQQAVLVALRTGARRVGGVVDADVA